MELFRNIRHRIGAAMLLKKIARTKRKVRYTKFQDIKSIGIVWDASKTAEFPSLSRFHQKMQDIRVDVKIFGYYPGKNLPDQLTAIRYLTCLKSEELNRFYNPASVEANSFINTQFDILIDINFDKVFPLNYVTALSKAGFKVGLFDSEPAKNTFDLMMELKKPVDIDGYLTQVVHYLEMIKDKSVITAE